MSAALDLCAWWVDNRRLVQHVEKLARQREVDSDRLMVATTAMMSVAKAGPVDYRRTRKARHMLWRMDRVFS